VWVTLNLFRHLGISASPASSHSGIQASTQVSKILKCEWWSMECILDPETSSGWQKRTQGDLIVVFRMIFNKRETLKQVQVDYKRTPCDCMRKQGDLLVFFRKILNKRETLKQVRGGIRVRQDIVVTHCHPSFAHCHPHVHTLSSSLHIVILFAHCHAVPKAFGIQHLSISAYQHLSTSASRHLCIYELKPSSLLSSSHSFR